MGSPVEGAGAEHDPRLLVAELVAAHHQLQVLLVALACGTRSGRVQTGIMNIRVSSSADSLKRLVRHGDRVVTLSRDDSKASAPAPVPAHPLLTVSCRHARARGLDRRRRHRRQGTTVEFGRRFERHRRAGDCRAVDPHDAALPTVRSAPSPATRWRSPCIRVTPNRASRLITTHPIVDAISCCEPGFDAGIRSQMSRLAPGPRPRAPAASRSDVPGLEALRVPLRPMIGCFGVAPDRGRRSPRPPPATHGGNMDYAGFVSRRHRHGSSPVSVPGALFFLTATCTTVQWRRRDPRSATSARGCRPTSPSPCACCRERARSPGR